MRRREELGAGGNWPERGQADKVETEGEGETRKQRLIVIDGGKQKDRVKGNEVLGHTVEGHTMRVEVYLFLGVFMDACKEPRDKKRKDRMNAWAKVKKWNVWKPVAASSIVFMFTFQNQLLSLQLMLSNLKVPHCAKYTVIQFHNTHVHLMCQQTPQKWEKACCLLNKSIVMCTHNLLTSISS